MDRKRIIQTSLVLLAGMAFALAVHGLADAQDAHETKFPKKTGVLKPGVQHDIAELIPEATFPVEGDPDWMALTEDAVWVASSSKNRVVRLDTKTNKPGTAVSVAKPCSGLVVDFGSLWIPSCGDHALWRVDAKTGAHQATIPAGPTDSEGGICSGAGSIWIVGSKESNLLRIDAATNRIVAHIRLPKGSFNPVFANESVWVSSNAGGKLVRVNPKTNTVMSETAVGPQPRFLTVGGGSIWVLNQGDGSIARVDAESGKRTAVIQAGIPGHGGEIAFGGGAVWATVMDFPITRIDVKTNEVTGQWHGAGGDSIRLGHGSVWLTNLVGAKVWRLPIPAR